MAPGSHLVLAASEDCSSTHCVSQVGAKSLGVYAVNYPASNDFASSDFPKTVIDGIRDAGSHIQSMAMSCPQTRQVLGGYSQGAAVADYVTSAVVPPAVPVQAVPAPMAPEVANHVAAVTLFGAPSAQFLGQYGAPPIAIGPLYQPKTLQLCADGDSICGDGNSPVAHGLYAVNGMVGQGANFAASRL
ncbi:serine esterase [Mycobacterium tuberculosis]|nr:serine esterase [Mycobacterium tuberculosis]